ncbi:hypothetical protein RhiJN_22745 [Ceratobasidium sp. AG-Ba]|nr:hypothetical protein RhiJN_22745 [Ceratobasidium sp. AG-Ba]
MRSLNGRDLNRFDLPHIWFASDSPSDSTSGRLDSMVPWLVRSWQPIPGQNVTVEIGFKARNFIVSSFLRDTIGGMSPKYETVSLFPLTLTRASPLDNSQISTGTFSMDTTYDYSSVNSLQTIRALKSSGYPLPFYCEVTQDYRASTALDLLSSIGGLLALLQSIHLLLFGKPMFWGLFGTKLISPFGLVGRLYSAQFRKRLRDHYRITEDDSRATQSEPTGAIRVFALLRDYVIDFGPADSSSSSSPDQCGRSENIVGGIGEHELRRRSRQQIIDNNL